MLLIVVPSKLLGQLVDILLESFIFLKTFDSKLSSVEVWLTDWNSNSQDKINITLVIS